MNNLNLNKSQALGLVLLITALTAWFIPAGWLMAWTPETQFLESYRGFDIYYIDEANVYTVDIGTGEVADWPYFISVRGCKEGIDLWEDGPTFVDDYRGGTIWQMPGYNLYYWESGNEKTNRWDSLESLINFVDIEYFPNLVYTIHYGNRDYEIFQQGYHDPVFWGELLEYLTPEFGTLAEVKDFIRADLEDIPIEYDTPDSTDNGEPATPPEDPGEPDTGNANPDETVDTVGEQIQTRKTMIAGVSGSMGLGLMVLGSIKRDEK